MALLLSKKAGTAAGAVLLTAAVVTAILLLLLSAAAPSVLLHDTVSPPPPPPPPRAAASRRQYYHAHVRYRIYLVVLRKPPNADAMNEDAHSRWHVSLLPSTTVIGYSGSGEPRLLDSYYRHGIYAFSAEVEDVAKKPGVLASRHCRRIGITMQCTMCPDGDAWDCGVPLLVSKPAAAAATASQK